MEVANESTPLKSNHASYTLGLTRAQLRLLRDPDTKEPWAFMGLCAPLKAFEVLGQGVAMHVRVLAYCLGLGVLLFFVSIPLRYTGMDQARASAMVSMGGTAGAWSELTWWHAASDICLVLILLTFFEAMARYTMNPAIFEGTLISKRLSTLEGGIRKLEKTAAAKLEKTVSKTVSSKPDFRDEMDKVESVGVVLEASYHVEACSIVVTGWGRGARMPKELLDAIVAVAGERPAYAVQPSHCCELIAARDELTSSELALGDALQCAREEGSERALAELEAHQRDVAGDKQALNQVRESTRDERHLLDYAFLTFTNSKAKTAVLDAARHGTLFTEGVPKSLVVQPGPNPRDVIWSSLEATAAERRYASYMFSIIMFALALVVSASLGAFLTIGALLQANTPFGLTLSNMFEGDFKRLGYFGLMLLGIMLAVQAIVQPIFCVYSNRGLCCQPALRLRCCTYTALFAKAGGFWMWVEFLIMLLIFVWHVLATMKDSPLYSVAVAMCEALGVPNKELNFYFLYNAEVQGNLIVATFVTFVMIWIVAGAGRYVIAPFQKTQAGIDHHCRMTDPAFLPFSTSDGMRVLAAVTLWCGVFPTNTFTMCIYYPVALFVVRTNLLGRFEPGPPTKPLQYRFVFVIYLPFHLLLHLLLCFGLYADVEVPHPQNLGSGLWPGFNTGAGFSNPAKVFHSLFCLLMFPIILVALPWMQRARALQEGVLTPWQICSHFLTADGLSDVDFGTSVRTARGVHHLTSPAYFGREAIGDDPVDFELPSPVPADALYNPSAGIDLLE